MMSRPLELTLELQPRTRYDAIDVAGRVVSDFGDVLSDYRRVLYCSHHTTAGYLDQGLASRLGHDVARLDPFVGVFRRLFPADAGYTHDQMHLRAELTEEQRRAEPPNGDAHLAFIGSGLHSCVTYDHHPGAPVYLMDLDGVYQGQARTRRTSLIAYQEESTVAEQTFEIPVSHHHIDSINLADERIGLMPGIRALLRRHPVAHGRVDIALDPREKASAVTVNEFETLLMRHDLAEVLRNPLRFVARQSRRMLEDPAAVPAKSIGYAKYDVVHLVNQAIDTLGLRNSTVEQLVVRLMAWPAARLLRWKRSVSLPVSSRNGSGPDLVHGQYQSPILIQWKASPDRTRSLRVTLTQFN